MSDIIKVLQGEHAKLKTQLLWLEIAPMGDRCRKRLLLEQFAALLQPHLAFHRDVVMPALGRHLSWTTRRKLGHASRLLLGAMQRQLAAIGAQDCGSPGFRAGVIELRQALDALVAEQDDVVFPLVRAHLTVEERISLASQHADGVSPVMRCPEPRVDRAVCASPMGAITE